MSIPSLYVMSTNVSFGVPVNSHKWHLIACFIIQICHKPLHFAPHPGTFTSEMDSSSSCRPSSKNSLLCEALPGPLRLTRAFPTLGFCSSLVSPPGHQNYNSLVIPPGPQLPESGCIILCTYVSHPPRPSTWLQFLNASHTNRRQNAHSPFSI